MENISVPVTIENKSDFERKNEPVRTGVPFPEGMVKDIKFLSLKDDEDTSIPVQKKVLAYWPDGSAKWVLLDFFVSISPDSHKTCFAYVDRGLSQSDPDACIRVEESVNSVKVDTGHAQFTISREGNFPFSSIIIDGKEVLSDRASETVLTDTYGKKLKTQVDEVVQEENGPVRCTVKAKGRFINSSSGTFANFISRISLFRGRAFAKIDFQIHNPNAAVHPGGIWDLGDPGSIYFKDLSIFVYPAGKRTGIQWASEQNREKIKSVYTDLNIYQDSSGGLNWDSNNHLDRNEHKTVTFNGYRVSIASEDSNNLRTEGTRATPFIRLDTDSAWASMALQDFWQNFPKAMEINEGSLKVALFPGECKAGFELQGGEKKRHTVFMDFGNEQSDESIITNVYSPVRVILSPNQVEESGAIPYIIPEDEDTNDTYTAYIKNIIEGENSFYEKREKIDEYGWRNFGDIYADHEAVNHKGPGLFISHYNNQYDFIYGALIHFMRSGDARWFELASYAAGHTMDIDIYHTEEDKAGYNYGLFWHTDHYRDAGTSSHRSYTRKSLAEVNPKNYGGGPANEHNYSSGLLLYYYLTGDQDARQAVKELAKCTIERDDGTRSALCLFDEGPTGGASSTADINYHKPGRGAGNSINTLLDAYQLENKRLYMSKAEELIQRCIHPRDDIPSLNLDDPEYRWSYLVFLQALGKYLDLKNSLGETDYYYCYARESLLHYADWMAENEVPYQEVLDKVDIPTETWPAQDIRKAVVFCFAYKYGTEEKRKIYLERANFFFERCLKDLLTWETAYLTRPMVILAVCGYISAWFRKNKDLPIFEKEHNYDFGEPQVFITQKARFRATFGRKVQTTVKLLRLIIRDKLRFT